MTRETITLADFNSIFFTRPTIAPTSTMYVFDDEESADSWVMDMYFNEDNRDYDLLFVLRSDMIAEYFLKEKWCKAKVQQFYAVEPDVLVVVIKSQEESEDAE